MHLLSKIQEVDKGKALTQVKQVVEVSTQTSSIYRSMVKAAQAEVQGQAEELVRMAHMVSEALEAESVVAQEVEVAKVQEVLAPLAVGKRKMMENLAESRKSDTLELRQNSQSADMVDFKCQLRYQSYYAKCFSTYHKA